MSPDGRVFYYSDYNALGGAQHNRPEGWTCGTGTRPMAPADLPAGEHRITVTVADEKPAASRGRFLNVAGFGVRP